MLVYELRTARPTWAGIPALRFAVFSTRPQAGGSTIRSIGDIAAHQRLRDNNEEFVPPKDMIAELRADNQKVILFLLRASGLRSD
jgi:starvation-inducible DNA-binding protein